MQMSLTCQSLKLMFPSHILLNLDSNADVLDVPRAPSKASPSGAAKEDRAKRTSVPSEELPLTRKPWQHIW